MDKENNDVMQQAVILQAETYGNLTRVEETIEFAKKMGFKKIGIATCTALIKESGILLSTLYIKLTGITFCNFIFIVMSFSLEYSTMFFLPI